MFQLRPKETLSMLTRDGVRLDADVYRPDDGGSFPVLVMRQPYGRAIASTVVYAHPTWYAAHGYIVVIQDVRGRGSSEGDFDLFAHEMTDGFDTIAWAADLPGSTGQVGMYGFSYQGMTQLYAAATRPSALKTICPSMIGYDLYEDWAYENGAFCYQLNLGWAIQLATETARRLGDATRYHTLYAASRNPPLGDPVCANSELLKQLAPDSFYHQWLHHSTPDDYWQILSPKSYLQEVNLPMLHIGGWFDTYLRGTLHLYQAMVSRSTYPQWLCIGPWAHLPWGRKTGAIDYGITAASDIDRLQIRWFDHFLKGQNAGLLSDLPIRLFEMGTNRWRSLTTISTTSPRCYYLETTGLAAISDGEGSLVPQVPRTPLACDRLVHDPWRPVPAVGGHATIPAGSCDRTALDCRTDILTYTSAQLTADLHLLGTPSVHLYCTADAISYDLCVVLSEVKPDGSVYGICQGYARIQPNRSIDISLATPSESPELVQIKLQATCIRIPEGSAVRLSISAACFPAYAVNAGDGSASGHGQLIDARVITLGIWSGGDRLSHLMI